MDKEESQKILKKLLAERILLMDGATGTMIQQHHYLKRITEGLNF